MKVIVPAAAKRFGVSKDSGFIRGSIGTGNLQGGPIALTTTATPAGIPRWGAAYRDFLAQYFSPHAVMVAQTRIWPIPTR